MTEQSSLQPDDAGGDRTTSAPAAVAGREPASAHSDDYRDQLGSRRWNAAPLKNPEAQKTDPWIVVAAIALLSAITFVVIVLGYSSGVWG